MDGFIYLSIPIERIANGSLFTEVSSKHGAIFAFWPGGARCRPHLNFRGVGRRDERRDDDAFLERYDPRTPRWGHGEAAGFVRLVRLWF